MRRQIVPVADETRVRPEELVDPLGEDSHNPTPAIVHKYPDRVLLLAVDRCAIYCRHCNRRRLVGGNDPTTRAELEQAFEYVARNRRIRDVLISGGDPLLLSTERLDDILGRLRAISSVVIPDASHLRNAEHRELFLSGLRLATGEDVASAAERRRLPCSRRAAGRRRLAACAAREGK